MEVRKLKKNEIAKRVRWPAVVLATAMLCSLFPYQALALAPPAPPAKGLIVQVSALTAEQANQTVPPKTALEELPLPKTLCAAVQSVQEAPPSSSVPPAQSLPEEAGQPPSGEMPPADGPAPPAEESPTAPPPALQEDGAQAEPEPKPQKALLRANGLPFETTAELPVSWAAEPEYQGETGISYRFTADFGPEYVLAEGLHPPVITVKVEENGEGQRVKGFEALPAELRFQSGYAPQLPEKLSATAEAKGDGAQQTAEVPVLWQSDTYRADTATGLHVFVASPGPGYFLAEGQAAPRITFIQKSRGRMVGAGSVANPLQISSVLQMEEIALLVNLGKLEEMVFGSPALPVYFTLITDLDLSGFGEGYDEGQGWAPIGNSAQNPFISHFDGGGHKLTGLYINRPGSDAVGLFGYIRGGTVANLGLVEARVSGGEGTGALAGRMEDSSRIENSFASGRVNGQGKTGGLVGECLQSSLSGSYSACLVNGAGGAGGLAGFVDGELADCYALGAVNGRGEGTGGLVGRFVGGSALRCYAKGSVSGGASTGGLLGDAQNTRLQNLYAAGAVSGGAYVGGLVGRIQGGGLSQAYAIGAVVGADKVAGLAGGAAAVQLNACAALNPSVKGGQNSARLAGEAAPDAVLLGNVAFGAMADEGVAGFPAGSGGAHVNGETKTAGETAQNGFFETLFAADEAWVYAAAKLPGFGMAAELPHHLRAAGASPFGGGDGSAEAKAYEIETPEQLQMMAELVNAGAAPYAEAGRYYKLTRDIDLAAYGAGYNGGKGWLPIGVKSGHAFLGNFDGGGYAIRGLYIENPVGGSGAYEATGLFGIATGSTIKNVTLEEADVTGADNTGGVVGRLQTSPAGVFTGCKASGRVAGQNAVGGLVGNRGGNITLDNCSSSASVSGVSSVGGVLGSSAGPFSYCFATGPVSGISNYVGGLVGNNSTGSISYSYATGCVTSWGTMVGGLAGSCNSGAITYSYASGHVSGGDYVGGLLGLSGPGYSIEHCYALGAVSGKTLVGGIAGSFQGANLRYCYATGAIKGSDMVGGITGRLGSPYGGNVYADHCFALNISVTGSVSGHGRVYGGVLLKNMGTPVKAYTGNNLAFAGMTDGKGTVLAGGNNGTDKNGASKTAEEIAHATEFTALFLNDVKWTYVSGMLPGFGAGVEMPYHLLPGGLSPFGGGDGLSEDTAYEIATVRQLEWMAHLVNTGTAPYAEAGRYFKLVADLNLAVCAEGYNGGLGWNPIGSSAGKEFLGYFNGGGHSITGLYIQNSGQAAYRYTGLFGCVKGGCVKALDVLGVNIEAAENTGAVAGAVTAGGVVAECYAAGRVSGAQNVGGLVGQALGGIIENSYSIAAVLGGQNVGGVVGAVEAGGAASYCYAVGPVQGETMAGGVAGLVQGGSLTNCAALGQTVAVAQAPAGRLAAQVSGSLAGGRALYSMGTGGGVAFGGQNVASGSGGANMGAADALNAAFWKDDGNWATKGWDAGIWKLEDGKLPILRVNGPASGDSGLYLTPRDAAYFTAGLNQTIFPYDGTVKLPSLTVRFGNQILQNEVDYDYAITSVDGLGTSAGVNAGLVRITVRGKGNYTGSMPVLYSISKRLLVIKADDKAVQVGEALPAPTLSYTGFVGDEGPGNTFAAQAQARYTVENTGIAGSYPIRIAAPAQLNTGHGANYTLLYQEGTLTVTELPSYTLAAQAGVGGSITPAGQVVVKAGENQTFSIKPASGYRISAVKVDGANQGAIESYTFTKLTANHSIQAIFEPEAGQSTSAGGAGSDFGGGGTGSGGSGASSGGGSTGSSGGSAPGGGMASQSTSALQGGQGDGQSNVQNPAGGGQTAGGQGGGKTPAPPVQQLNTGGQAATARGDKATSGPASEERLHIPHITDGGDFDIKMGESFTLKAEKGSLQWDETRLHGVYDEAVGAYVFTALETGTTQIISTDQSGDETLITVKIEDGQVPLARAKSLGPPLWMWIVLPALLALAVFLILFFWRRKKREEEEKAEKEAGTGGQEE